MKTFRFLLFFSISAAIFACNEPTTVSKPKVEKAEPVHPYAGKVFFFAPKLDKTTCEVFGDCECCWDNLIFLDEVRFVRIYYCDADQDYRTGTYSLKNDSIFLIYNDTGLDHELNWNYDEESLEDTTLPGGFNYVTEQLDQLLDTIATIECRGEKRLKTGFDEIFFGQPDVIKPFTDYIKELKADSIDKRLEIRL